MDEQRIGGKIDFETLRRAIERGDTDAMLEFYADDAGVRVLDGDTVSFEVDGKAEVAKYLRAVYARPADRRVENEAMAEDRIHFEESCECFDGTRTVVATTLEIREGEISRQVDAVVDRNGPIRREGRESGRDI